MRKTYYYGLQAASELGHTEHPQREIRQDFPDAADWRPESVGDCWFFSAEEHSGPLPKCYLPCGEDGVPVWNYHEAQS